MSWISVFLIVGLFLPSNSVLHYKTYGALEFILSGDERRSFSSAQSWCKQHGSTLAEITSEHIWNRTLEFIDEFEWNGKTLLLNANGKQLPAWQWITGEPFRDVDSYPLKIDEEMYGRLSKIGNQTLSITQCTPNCEYGCSNGYICEHLGDWSCKGTHSSNSIPLDGNCYVFHHDKRIDWFEAYYECQKNNGRLATFKNIKEEEASIAQKLEHGRKYWIGLYRYEWRWADSNELLGFSNWQLYYPHHAHACIYVYWYTNKWLTNECNSLSPFVCLRDVTKCVTNPCQNNATCSYVDNNYTCQCAPGFTGSYCETKHANECDDDPCRNGATCIDSARDYIRSFGSAGSECQAVPSPPYMMLTIIIVVVVISVVFPALAPGVPALAPGVPALVPSVPALVPGVPALIPGSTVFDTSVPTPSPGIFHGINSGSTVSCDEQAEITECLDVFDGFSEELLEIDDGEIRFLVPNWEYELNHL